MRYAELGRVADVNWGDTSITKSSYVESGYPAYSATGGDGFLPYYDFERDGIVLSAIGARCGKTWFATGKWSVIKNTIRFWSETEELDNRYLYWLTNDPNFWPKRGAAQPFITIGDARKLTIPIPPLDEQKRIAAILDQADELRRKRQRSIDRLNQLGQAIFYEMFGDFDEGSAPVTRLGVLTSKIGSGATPKGGDSAYKAKGTPLIRSMNVRDGEFSEKGLAFLDDQQAGKLNNVIVQANDVLLNITGASVARVCLAPPHMEGARVNQHVSIIRLSKSITSELLEAFLLMPRTKRKLLTIAEAGATRQAITKAQIEELEVPVPELARQREFISRLKLARQSAASMSSQCTAFESMFASLQHRAFQGKL